MKQLTLACFIFFYSNFLFPQPTIQWQKSYGGTKDDSGLCLSNCIDGSLIVAGFSFSNDGQALGNHGSADVWLVKINMLGNFQWQKCYGGSVDERANSIVQTSDGGFIFAGGTNSIDGDVSGFHCGCGNFDYWIVKVDSLGSIQLQKTLGGTSMDFANSIIQTKNGDYIVVGYATSRDGDVDHLSPSNDKDYWVVKLDNGGNIIWKKAYGGTSNDEAASIKEINSNRFIISGSSDSHDSDVTNAHGNSDCWVIVIDSLGVIQWQKTIGGSLDDYGNNIIISNDGAYLISGSTLSNDGDITGNHGNSDYLIFKLDSNGIILWQKCFGGSGAESSRTICQTKDGGYLAGGRTSSQDGNVSINHGSSDIWIVKLDNFGNIQWEKSLGGSGIEFIGNIIQTTDDGFIFNGGSESNDGDVSGNHGVFDMWVVKLNPLIDNTIEVDSGVNNIQISPNPVIESTSILFSIKKKPKVSLPVGIRYFIIF